MHEDDFIPRLRACASFGALVGAYAIGIIQDKFGHSHSILCVTLSHVFTMGMFMLMNETGRLDSTAFLVMFSLGFLTASAIIVCNVILGFEFESKITPFTLKALVTNMAAFVMLVITTSFV